MSKVILNLELVNQQLTAQGVSDFVLDLKHVVGLFTDENDATNIVYKVGEHPAVTAIVTNTFDELADALISFNNDFFVASKLKETLVDSLVPAVVMNMPVLIKGQKSVLVRSGKFLVNAKRLIGVARVNGLTEITLKAPETALPERKAYYVDVSKIDYADIQKAITAQVEALKGREVYAQPQAPKPVKYIIEEDFDEIASLVVDGSFDPEKD